LVLFSKQSRTLVPIWQPSIAAFPPFGAWRQVKLELTDQLCAAHEKLKADYAAAAADAATRGAAVEALQHEVHALKRSMARAAEVAPPPPL
jgi:hypothetical protein